MFEKQMSPFSQLIYRFSSRGLLWPAIYGSVFGICIFHFSTFISALIGCFIGYLLILPLIGIISPFTFAGLLIVASIIGQRSADPFWGKVALILLIIHIFRTVAMFVLVKKYPSQTQVLDAQYQRR